MAILVLNPKSEQEAPAGPDRAGFRRMLANRLFDGYCESSVRQALIEQGAREFDLDEPHARHTVDSELQSRAIANEVQLLVELDGTLHQFSDSDRKLDRKERDDAFQLVCRPRPGFAKGLKTDVADKYIVDFCRQNNVKLKTGLFSWAVP